MLFLLYLKVLAISGCKDEQVSWEKAMWIDGVRYHGGQLTLMLLLWAEGILNRKETPTIM